MGLKVEFVERAMKPGARMSVLCREYGISRETGYKWLNRFKREGPDGLEERSRRPQASPIATAEEVVLAVLELREAYPRRGPKKLFVQLQRKLGAATPSIATIARILKRFGMARRKSKFGRPVSIVEKAPVAHASACNEFWTVDFKGWWRARDGQRCEPLTVRDAFSRYVLAVQLLRSNSVVEVQRVFDGLFRKYGVPLAIQCDNGVPFIDVRARGGLTRLSAWWVSLGIRIVRSRPGCPQDNGAHERMHRDMSADLQAFPAGSRIAEQRACDRWRQEFNHLRPHEALGGETPATLYKRSATKPRATKFLYPPPWTVRTVDDSGSIKIVGAAAIYVGRGLARQRLALQPVEGLRHRLWFRNLDLGTVDLPMPNRAIDEALVEHQYRRADRARERIRTKNRAA